ncbi:glycosyltransferase family 87 protein [Nesterenkonia muleiensis]|uniref:glycosyltransferase family 87 protein n=1 Tax=Nesterenkonia muleiensis TaxID=2282648 RepID=UPI0013009D53|nr:hypothetical protein [Nesterenkonia muleiensis]
MTENDRPCTGGMPGATDPLVRHLSDRWGGPAGSRLATPRRGFWTIPRILTALTTLGVLLAVLSSQYCRINGWGGTGVYHWGCYSDVAALWGSRDFAQHPWAPFLESYSSFEYPALTMFLASALAAATYGADAVFGGTALDYWGERTGLLYWDLTFLLGALSWFVLTLAVMKAAGACPWRAAIVALSPAIILGVGINWDIFAAAALGLAVLFCLRRQWWLAGVLVGVGVSVKLYPLFLLGAVFTLALRQQWRPESGPGLRWADFARLTAAGALTWAALNVPVMLISFDAWAEFYVFSADRGAGWSSIWQVWGVLTGSPLSAETVSTWSFLMFAASCLAVLLIGLTAPQRPGLVQLLLLIVAAFLVFNKVYSPQFMIWLVPLIALAGLKMRDVLIWHGFQILHFWAIWMHLAAQISASEPQHLFDENLYVAAVFGHVASTLYICAMVIRDLYRPQSEPSAVGS